MDFNFFGMDLIDPIVKPVDLIMEPIMHPDNPFLDPVAEPKNGLTSPIKDPILLQVQIYCT